MLIYMLYIFLKYLCFFIFVDLNLNVIEIVIFIIFEDLLYVVRIFIKIG